MKSIKKFTIAMFACIMMMGTVLAPTSSIHANERTMPACPNCYISGPVEANAAIFCGKCGKFVGTTYHCQKCSYFFDVRNPHRC